MKTPSIATNRVLRDYFDPNEISNPNTHLANRWTASFADMLKQLQLAELNEVLTKLAVVPNKKNFLVFRSNKYLNVPTENIAMFYIKYESAMLMCFDKQEYYVNYSLEQIGKLVSQQNFFRLNRQCMVNFHAIKEVEHYFARKLLVNLSIPVKDKLLVSKEKVTEFLHWLDNR